MNTPGPGQATRREWLAVAALVVIGLGLRVWPVGRLGLSHFDEGIYAWASIWSLLPRGLAGIDPTLIPYAPPGYPILGGIAYVVLGRSDGAMIAVSQAAGTLIIPVVAWLARRAFGPGTGVAAATLCAFSGPHIAYSRMAMTDASFLLAWLLALGAGTRFLERPGFARAIVMGLGVGLAQEFKYNGWLAGAVVVGSAAAGLARPGGREAASIARTFGWGGLAAGVAWLVVWPWYVFVERHGGYSALLRHQRGYLGGWRDWWPNLSFQVDQAVALSGGWSIVLPALILLGLGWWSVGQRAAGNPDGPTRSGALIRLLAAAVFWSKPHALGLVASPFLLASRNPARRLVGVWWLLLAALTPFYHPYSRLWLPFEAAHWLILAWLLTSGLDNLLAVRPGAMVEGWPRLGRLANLAKSPVGALTIFGALIVFANLNRFKPPPAGLLDPSDSLYRACVKVADRLPPEVKTLRLLARPAVSYYLAGRVGIERLPDSRALLHRGSGDAWALVDSSILRSDPGPPVVGSGRNRLDQLAGNWEVVDEFPTMPGLPTLLDLDPRSARSTAMDRACPLWLLRPRIKGSIP